MRSQYYSAHEDHECQVRHDNQEMRNFDISQLERHFNEAFNFSAGAFDSDNIWRKIVEELDWRLAEKLCVHSGA